MLLLAAAEQRQAWRSRGSAVSAIANGGGAVSGELGGISGGGGISGIGRWFGGSKGGLPASRAITAASAVIRCGRCLYL